MPVECMENLSNEVFYEIFDYLDGYDIYQAFSNLNTRYQVLLLSPLLLLKIQFSSQSESILDYRYNQFIYSNKQRFISFHFHNQSLLNKFLTLHIIDFSFTRLESLVLKEISTFKLMVLLFYLQSLPRLFSLIICLDDCHEDLGDIYQIIFRLPFLKYFKLEITGDPQLDITIPIFTNEQISPIEYLSIYHHCPLNILTNILSYTPRITHLYCLSITESLGNIESEMFKSVINLVHLTVSININFDEFEEFIIKLSSQSKLLTMTFQCWNKSYLDGNRWEQLILQHMVQLNRFHFYYSTVVNEKFEIDRFHGLMNPFTTSFWIKRQWIFHIGIENEELIYLINPYRRKWYDFQEYIQDDDQMTVNSLVHYFPNVQLSVHTKENRLFINKISPIFEMIHITHLDVYYSSMSIRTLIQIFDLLPNINSMRISTMPLLEDIHLCEKDVNLINIFLMNNKITKVTLRNISSLEQIDFIIDLFPRMQYFALERISNVDLELAVRLTLSKIKENNMHHPMTICVYAVEASYDKIETLKKMIDLENLLNDYTIHRQCNRFYLKWK